MPATGRIAAASTAVAGALVVLLSACSAQEPVSLANGGAGGTSAPAASSSAADAGTELADPTSPPATTAAPTPRASVSPKKAVAKKASTAATASRAAASAKAASPKAASPKAASVSPVPTKASSPATRKPSPTASAGGGSGGGSGGATTEEASVVELTNAERAKNGCGPLSINAALTTVARAHSKDMAVNKYFDHNSQDGRTPFDRMKTAGYAYSMAAENIAAGQPSAASVVTAWMNSEGHRANILNCKLTQIGVGIYRMSGSPYGVYWTQDFGTPR